VNPAPPLPLAVPLAGAAAASARPLAWALEIQSVDPGRSIGWWADAGTLLLRCPLRWAVLAVVLMAAPGLAALLPALGPYAAALLSPLAVGLWMQAAHDVQRGGTLNAAALRPVLRRERLRPLLVLGAVLAAATLAMHLVGHLFGLDAMRGPVGIDAPSDIVARAALGQGMLALLLLLVCSLLVSAAFWFAPALVVLRGASPARAVAASLRAVRDNALTFLLYAVVQLLLAAAALALLQEAAWALLLPLMLHTGYLSYREVFEG
jgi:uncharacterized membrane protein